MAVVTVNPGDSIQDAVRGLVNGGEVRLLPGVHPRGFALYDRAYPADSPLVVSAEPGARVVGPAGTLGEVIGLEGCGNVVLRGLDVSGARRLARKGAGVRVVECTGVTVENCDLHENSHWGLFAGFVHHLTVRGCAIWGQREEHGLYVSNSSRDILIAGNAVRDNFGSGIHFNGDQSNTPSRPGFEHTGMVERVAVADNIVERNARMGGAGVNMDGVTDAVVWDNVVTDNVRANLAVFRYGGSEPCSRLTFFRNHWREEADLDGGSRVSLAFRGGADLIAFWGNLIECRRVDYPFSLVQYPDVGSRRVWIDWNRYAPAGFFGVREDQERDRDSFADWQRRGYDRNGVEGEGGFPDAPPPPVIPLPDYAGRVVSVSCPRELPFARAARVTVTAQNKGRLPWPKGGPLRLATADDNLFLGTNRLAPVADVPPGGTGEFAADVLPVIGGTYPLHFVVEGSHHLPRDVAAIDFRVTAPAEPTPVPVPPPPGPWADVVGALGWVLGERGHAAHAIGAYADPQKVLFRGIPAATVSLAALVRIDAPLDGDDTDGNPVHRAGLLVGAVASAGTNFLVTPRGVQWLRDGVQWSVPVPFTPELGRWYAMRVEVLPDTSARGKLWSPGDPEPSVWRVCPWPVGIGRCGYNGGCAAASFRPLGGGGA